MVTYEERLAVFKSELELILDPIVLEFTKLCLSEVDEYVFVDCPASSSGKYHPISELGADGTIIHTKKVVTVAYELCRGLGCENYRDEIISACIIHDLLKQGKTKSGHTQKNHPALAANLVESVQGLTGLLSDESFSIIKNAVGFHYGLWSTKDWLKDLKEYTPMELCVYLSDYIASKRCIEVDYRRFSVV
jgi:hypothetical protein